MLTLTPSSQTNGND